MHIIAPPSHLIVNSNGSDTVLTWNPSTDSVLGYYVYRKSLTTGFYERISPFVVTTNNLTVNTVVGNNDYMVRAIRLELSSSGTYYNLSTGILKTVTLANSEYNLLSSNYTVFPNPNNGKFEINIDSNEISPAIVQLISIDGRVVLTKNIITVLGKNSIYFDEKNLSKGIYYIKIYANNTSKMLKVIID